VMSGEFSQSLAYSLLTAICFNWGLLGILCAQTFAYYAAFPRDGPLAKVLVYGVLLLEIAQTTVVSRDVFVALTSPWDTHPMNLDSVHNHWFSVPVAGGISGGIGQLFFAYRIWYISCANSRGAPIIISILATGSAISALASADALSTRRLSRGCSMEPLVSQLSGRGMALARFVILSSRWLCRIFLCVMGPACLPPMS